MSSAIDFAVRTSAGGTTYGDVAGPGQSTFIQAGLGDKLSLNLTPQSVIGYTRSGNDLLIELSDGRTITVADWFDAPVDNPNQLYLSSDGMVTEVALADPGDGILVANFSLAAGHEKWSPLDDLRFDNGDPVVTLAGTGEDDPAGMGIFAPALLGWGGAGAAGAAVIGGAALLGGGSGGGGAGGGDTGGGGTGGGDTGGGGPTFSRSIDGAGTSTTITTNTAQPAITVSGTGIPGDSVAVSIGTQTRTVTVAADGTWTAGFSGPTLPADGTHTATAVFTGGGATDTLTGGGFIIDMTPPTLAATEGTQSTGAVENLAEYANGVTIGGTSEPGATVNVTLGTPGTPGAITRPATMNPDGTWTITFTPQEIAGGERTQSVTIVASDRLGNTRSLTETIVLDTIAPPLAVNNVSGDNLVNREESQSQVLISGTATANTTVTLSIQGIPGTISVTANGNGVWSHPIAANTLTDGTYTFTATTVDAAGNPTQRPGSFRVDTQMSVAIDPADFAGNNVVNLSESNGTLTLTGTVPADATRVEVQWLGQPVPAILNGNGTWSIQFPAGSAGTVTRDSTITVTAWDAAGNKAESPPRPVRIDLETNLSVEASPVGTERILSSSEQRAGFTLDGEGEVGARVFLNLNGTDHGPAIVGNDGKWAYTFTPASLAGLTDGQAGTITAYAVDTANNRSATETRTFTVDTSVGNFTFAAPDLVGTANDGPRDATVLNAAERNAGVLVEGTVEPGSSVVVAVAGSTWSFTIPGSATQGGTWSTTVPASALPQGNAASATITATATDAQGNTALPQQRTIGIDTVVADFNAADIRLGTGTDTILNAREHAIGLPVEGRAEAGATVTVSLRNPITNQVHTLTDVADGNGLWSVNFTANQIPTGERTGIPISVTATDTAGNISGPFTQNFAVDTILPGTPIVIETQDVAGAMRGLTTTATNDQYSFHRVDAMGAPTALTATETHDSFFNEDAYRFQNGQTVPDGSYLVINTRDVAGNEATTLFIKNTATGATVDLTRDGLDNFDFTAIDLTRAPDARLTLSAQQLEQLTGPDQTLVIKGESTDQVTLENVTNVQHNQTINGALYDIYTLGDSGARVMIEDDVTRTVI